MSVLAGHPVRLHGPLLKSKTTSALALSGQSETVEIPKANAAGPNNLRLNQADILVLPDGPTGETPLRAIVAHAQLCAPLRPQTTRVRKRPVRTPQSVFPFLL